MVFIALLLTCVVLVIATLLATKIRQFIRLYRMIEKLPGPKANLPIGQISLITGDQKEVTKKMEVYMNKYREDYPLMRLWFGPVPFVLLLSADANQEVLKSSTLIDKSRDYKGMLKQWMGDGLLASGGSKWRSRRKMITKSFHFSILDSYIAVMHKKVRICVSLLKQKALAGEPFDLEPFIGSMTLDIICETAMGIDIEAQTTTKYQEYQNAVVSSTGEIIDQFRNPLYWFKPFYNIFGNGLKFNRYCKIMHEVSRKMITERRAAMTNNPSFCNEQRVSFLDTLLRFQDEDKLTDHDIWEEVETFMFEGHETTSTSIVFTLFALGNHPDVQRKVLEEINEILGDNCDECPLPGQLKKMKYLKAVIYESLRLWPAVPMMFRDVSVDTVVENYTIPKGSTILMCPYTVQTDHKYYGSTVDEFDPDRFLDELRDEDRHPFAFLAFSAGPRNCIGQRFAIEEILITVSSIVQEFEVKCITKMSEVVNIVQMVNRPSQTISTLLIPRKTHQG